MNRHVTGFDQLLTHTDLNTFCQADAEEAMNNLISDISIFGVITGGVVSEHAVPNFTVDITGPCVAYNQAGERCYMGVAQVLNCAIDYLGVATVPAVPGDHRWISVHLRFARELSDLRMDGNDPPVPYYWSQAESFVLRVVSGLAGPAPARPAKPSDAILLCDIDLVQGMASIVNADIYTDRRDEFQWLPAGVVTVDDSGWTKIDPAATVQAALDNVDTMLIDRNGSGEITEASLVPSVNEGLTIGSNPKRVNVYAHDVDANGVANLSGTVNIAASNGYLSRRFDYLADGVSAMQLGDEFTVGKTTGHHRFNREILFSFADTIDEVSDICMDHARVFVAFERTLEADAVIKAFVRTAGVWGELWTHTTYGRISGICCDGERVFYCGAWDGLLSDNVVMLNALTGVKITGISTHSANTSTAHAVACDGSNLIYCRNLPGSTDSSIFKRTYTASTISAVVGSNYLWSGAAGVNDNATALCIIPFANGSGLNSAPVFVAGGTVGGVGKILACVTMSDMTTELWSANGISVSGVCSDGDLVFVSHAAEDLVGAGYGDFNAHARNLFTGEIVWTGVSPDATADRISTDGVLVFTSDQSVTSGYTYPAKPVHAITAAGVSAVPYYNAPIAGPSDGIILGNQSCNGHELAFVGADGLDLCVCPVSRGHRRFSKMSSTDSKRIPGFTLAQPMDLV